MVNDSTDRSTSGAGDGQQNKLTDDAIMMAFGKPFERVSTGAQAPGDRQATPSQPQQQGEMAMRTRRADATPAMPLDSVGRPAAVTNSRGETTTFHYDSNNKDAKVDGYVVKDRSGRVIENAQRDQDGTFAINGDKSRNITDVRVGQGKQVDLVNKDGVHEVRQPMGNTVRFDQRLAPQVLITPDGRQALSATVTSETTPDGRHSDYHYMSIKGQNDGKQYSVVDGFSVRDANNQVKEVAVKTADGKWQDFKAHPNEAGLPVGPDQIRQLQAAAGNPQQFSQLVNKFGLGDHQVRGNDVPVQVQVEMNGRRVEYHANGEQTWSTINGGNMHRFPSVVGDPRGERKVYGEPDGHGGEQLKYFEGGFDQQRNQQKRDSFKYDDAGNIQQVHEQVITYGKDAQNRPVPQVQAEFTLTRKGNQWVDGKGVPQPIQVESSADGSVTIRNLDNTGRPIQERVRREDGSEVVRVPGPDGRMHVRHEVSAAGTITDFGYDNTGRLSQLTTQYPTGQTEVWSRQSLAQPQNGFSDVWSKTQPQDGSRMLGSITVDDNSGSYGVDFVNKQGRQHADVDIRGPVPQRVMQAWQQHMQQLQQPQPGVASPDARLQQRQPNGTAGGGGGNGDGSDQTGAQQSQVGADGQPVAQQPALLDPNVFPSYRFDQHPYVPGPNDPPPPYGPVPGMIDPYTGRTRIVDKRLFAQ